MTPRDDGDNGLNKSPNLRKGAKKVPAKKSPAKKSPAKKAAKKA
jgi:hypothetical protein